MIKFVETFLHKNTYFIIKEQIVGRILSTVIKERFEFNYTEDFCQYTLYCVAKGLESMH